MAGLGILREGKSGSGARLSLTIAFKDGAAEAHLQEVEDLRVDGGGASNHDSASATKDCSKFVADKFVISIVFVTSIVLQIVKLAINGSLGEAALHTLEFFKASSNFIVNSIEKTRYRWEHGRLEGRAIFSELKHITTVETNLGSVDNSSREESLLK